MNDTDSTVTPAAWFNKVPRTRPPNATTLTELRQSRGLQRSGQVSQADAELSQAVTEMKTAPSVTGKLLGSWNVAKGAFMKTMTTTAKAINDVTDATSSKVQQLRFRQLFPESYGGDNEAIVAAFEGKIIDNTIPIAGTIWLTTKRICFHNGGSVKLAMPYREIVAICECITADTYEGRPYLIRKPADNVISDAVQVYATERRLFEFTAIVPHTSDSAVEVTNHQFKKRDAARMMYSSLFELWGTHVPTREVAGVEYSEV